MHPSLEVSNLAKLPLTLRERANASVSGSATHTIALANSLDDMLLRHERCLLPIFYAALDPTQIPTFRKSISSSTAAADFLRGGPIWLQCAAAIFSLRAIWKLKTDNLVPVPTYMDLWNRICPWIQFLDEFYDLLPGPDIMAVHMKYGLYLSLFRSFRLDPDVSNLINNTPQLCVVVGRAWSLLMHTDSKDDVSGGIGDVSYFFGRFFEVQTLISPVFDNFVSGAGGQSQLASLVVSQITRAAPAPDAEMSRYALLLLGTTMAFVDEPVETEDYVFFRDALLAQGIVPAITTAIQALSYSTHQLDPMMLTAFLTALVSLLSVFPRHKWLVQSLRAGLMNAIIRCGGARYIDHTRLTLNRLMRDILPPATVYRSVLIPLRVSLRKTHNMAPSVQGWNDLLRIVEPRFNLLNRYDLGQFPKSSVCDNLQCNAVISKPLLKCCGGCRAVVYCSAACQRADWMNGDHRWRCMELLNFRRTRQYTSTSAQDRSFFRALVHHDYLCRREEIAIKELAYIRQERTPYLTFDYTHGGCEIVAGAVEDHEAVVTDDEEEEDRLSSDSESPRRAPRIFYLSEDMVRAARWPGRMQMHFMEVLVNDSEPARGGDGEKETFKWTFSLRYPLGNGGFMQGLRAIAEEVPESSDASEECQGRVRELIRREEDGFH
ncbi:hypothetical protein R3P38DRAFT_2704484 [Favolaschia claudopus]|uniref:phytol kinase n=1 Tax=Favolaschia claudopus TaxID=2862362 RepID=A0AAW0BR69_9AGAR